MKRVYVVCATGVATSTILRMKIDEFLRVRGIDAQVTQFRVTELSPSRLDADVIVATTSVPEELAEVVPVINGIPLITGQGEDQALQRLLHILEHTDSPQP
jgi:PTS system galactitol-specific IIB component